MSRQTDREKVLRAAMANLLMRPDFHAFCDAIRELREGAVAYAISHTTVRDQRESLTALGEVRAYQDILAIVDAHQQPVEHGMAEEQPPGE